MDATSPIATRVRILLALALVAVVAAACKPGGTVTQASAPPPPASTGVTETEPFTLTIWDQECCQVSKVWDQLNDEFEATYPNVTIDRVKRDFGQMKTLLRLAIQGPNPPDVVEGNLGWPDMGGLVKAGLLLPLDNYADAYGWRDRVSQNVLSLSTWSSGGKEWGTGELFGYTSMGELIGVYYNKQKLEDLGLQVPATFDEFVSDLEAAKQAGEVPIQFANNDAWPGIHEYGVIQDRMAPVDYLTDLIFSGQGGTLSFDTPENMQAAATLQEWANKGYFTPGFGGGGYDDAVANYVKGEGVFMITGNWIVADLGADNTDYGFFLLPPMQAGDPPVSTGGSGFPLSITAASDHPDAAAAYIDFMNNDHAIESLLPVGNLPLTQTAPPVQEGTVLADVVTAAGAVSDSDGVVPYEDYATPTFYDTISAAIQELMVNRITPQEFVSRLQQDYSEFQTSRA